MVVIQPLSTRLIKPNFCFDLSHQRSTTVSLETRSLFFPKIRSLMLPSKPLEEATERTCTSCPTKRTISCQSQRYKRSGYSLQLLRYTTSRKFLTSERNTPGLGLIGQEYRIPLKDDAVPVCLYTPRRVPHPLLPKVKEKLDSMVHDNVISPVTVPTDWCSGMLITPKRNGDIRICVDLTNLNKAVKRAIHLMASVDKNLAEYKNS